jgi:ubiquitin-protein ligase
MLIERILNDIKLLETNSLDKFGIYYHWNENNIFNIKVLIIGPNETPYENGFFFFDIEIPSDYPMIPPKVIFCNKYNNIRYSPNLYINGKVCLSILNTWNGPQWTPCYTLSSILMTLIGYIFVKHSLSNEPAFQYSLIDSTKLLETYDDIIEHETLNGAVLYVLENIPNGFEVFKEKIEKYFIENYTNYINKTKIKMFERKKNIIFQMYNIKIEKNYFNLNLRLQNIYKKISGENFKNSLILSPDENIKNMRNIAKNINIEIDEDKKILYQKICHYMDKFND